MSRPLSPPAVAILAALCGCYRPTIPDGALLCAADSSCPSGFHCADDARCWRSGKDPAPQAPFAPYAVTALAGVRSAQVSWLGPSWNGGSPLTGFRITASPGGLFADVSGPASGVISGLADGTAYSFTVAARNALGVGAASDASPPFTTWALPAAPANLAANAVESVVVLSWSAPGNGGSPILYYTVSSDPPGIGSITHGASATIFLVQTGGTYRFNVAATNAVGTGPPSPFSASFTAPSAPGAPTGVTVTAGVRSATVQFVAPSDGGAAITGYRVLQSLGQGTFVEADAAISGTQASVSGLVNGGAYRFEVAASNRLGEGPPSAASDAVQLPDLPGKPENVVASAATGSAQVTWSAPQSDGRASILGYTAVASSGQRATSTGASATVNGLASGAAVTFTVFATNAVGDGPPSDPSAAITPTRAPPPAPPEAEGDLDGDGEPDRAVGTARGLLLRLSKSGAVEVDAGARPLALLLLDLEGRGVDDVVALADGELLIFRNDGEGMLSAPVRSPACPAPCSLAASSRDGRPAVVLTSGPRRWSWQSGDQSPSPWP